MADKGKAKAKAKNVDAKAKARKAGKAKGELSAEDLDKVSGGGMPDSRHHAEGH